MTSQEGISTKVPEVECATTSFGMTFRKPHPCELCDKELCGDRKFHQIFTSHRDLSLHLRSQGANVVGLSKCDPAFLEKAKAQLGVTA